MGDRINQSGLAARLLAPGIVVSLLDMLKFNADSFFAAASWAHQIEGVTRTYEKTAENADAVLSHSDRKVLMNGIKKLKEELAVIGAKFTVMQVKRFQDGIKSKDTKYSQVRPFVENINLRLIDELKMINLYIMESGKDEYFRGAMAKFGDDVLGKFPSAIGDIEDAGRSLACGQGTAAVFHLMRVMEVGLKSLAVRLGIDYAPSWDGYLNQILRKINAPRQEKDDDWKAIEGFCRDVVGDLQIVKMAWRNPTMHVARRYSAEEAEAIFGAVRGFIVRLSSELKEQFDEVETEQPC